MPNKPLNIKKAEELVKTYRSISYLRAWIYKKLYPRNWKNKLTGFGKSSTCNLCIAVHDNCNFCIHAYGSSHLMGNHCTYDISYKRIDYAGTVKKYLEAIHIRADYLENLIKDYNKQHG